MPEDRDPRYIGLVHGYDQKPKRRLFELLKTQGPQANQDVTFLTDGGEEVRALTELVTPEAEHVLDWFHIAMRLTVLEQYARGVAHHDADKGARLLDPARRPPAAANPHPCLGWHAPAIVRAMAPGAVQRQSGQRQSGRSGVNAPALSHGLQASLRLL